ncbi:hypothetical protein [Herbidospora daliensis]|uniref:hypothetical protein n=1 Tax=Herbidospora daliensis TaxID=295585 RepID=UPI0007816701|nr:hypothetical protein [Herbidospora daliensis]
MKGLAVLALTAGVLGALSAPAAAVEPDGGVLISITLTDPTKYWQTPIVCGSNMHWGNPDCANDNPDGGAE